MAATSMRVIIAGGGIGGLATALALARHGIPSQVYERHPRFPEEGAGIQIGPNGTRILMALGAGELLRKQAATPTALSVRDAATARELTHLPLGAWIRERHGFPYWTAHRKDLHAALRQRAAAEPLVTLTPGVEITSYEDDGNAIHARSANGEILNGSVLIAADGLWSMLRRQIAGNGVPRPVGKVAYRTVVASEHLPTGLVPNAVHIWLAPGAHIVHYPVNAGHDIALVVIVDDPLCLSEWDVPAPDDAVRDKILHIAEPLQSLVGAARNWRHWSLQAMTPLARWATGRAALLGDAAHPMLPFLAQGAVMALEDATVLAARLAKSNGNVAASLQAYQDDRRPRALRVAEASRRNGRIYHLAGAAALARNGVMKVLPSTLVMAGFDWLYGWKGLEI
jgi:salicylate hydroxylase